VFVVSGSGYQVDSEEARGIVDWPRQMTRKEVQQMIGLWNFYPQFIHYFSRIVSPITDLLWQDFTCKFRKAQEAAVLIITV
jgi:hypothetical protein